MMQVLILAVLPTSASAIKVKLRLDLPFGGSYSIQGLDSFETQGGFGIGLGVLIPYDQDMALKQATNTAMSVSVTLRKITKAVTLHIS